MNSTYFPKGYMPVIIGKQVHILMGGPYVNKPAHYYGVKMAAEIDKPCHIDIPTRDFNIPDEKVFLRGIVEGYVRMLKGQHLYVGCMGGIGRTGLYMAGMAKVMYMAGYINQPVVEYVREYYLSHAVETTQQIQFINNLEVEGIANWLETVAP